MRTRIGVLGPQLPVRPALGDRFGDCQRVPDAQLVEDQDGHAAGLRVFRDALRRIVDVKRYAALVEFDLGLAQQEPGPQ